MRPPPPPLNNKEKKDVTLQKDQFALFFEYVDELWQVFSRKFPLSLDYRSLGHGLYRHFL